MQRNINLSISSNQSLEEYKEYEARKTEVKALLRIWYEYCIITAVFSLLVSISLNLISGLIPYIFLSIYEALWLIRLSISIIKNTNSLEKLNLIKEFCIAIFSETFFILITVFQAGYSEFLAYSIIPIILSIIFSLIFKAKYSSKLKKIKWLGEIFCRITLGLALFFVVINEENDAKISNSIILIPVWIFIAVIGMIAIFGLLLGIKLICNRGYSLTLSIFPTWTGLFFSGLTILLATLFNQISLAENLSKIFQTLYFLFFYLFIFGALITFAISGKFE